MTPDFNQSMIDYLSSIFSSPDVPARIRRAALKAYENVTVIQAHVQKQQVREGLDALKTPKASVTPLKQAT